MKAAAVAADTKDISGVTFKTAHPEDSQTISDLVNSAYRGDNSKQGWTTEADYIGGTRTTPELILAMLNTPRAQIDLAFDESENLIGCVYINREGTKRLYFGMLTTSPLYQGKGLGKKMISHVEGIAKKESFTELKITVLNVRAELIEFYERRGFKATGDFEKFPDNDPAYGIPKVSGLKLLEFIKKDF